MDDNGAPVRPDGRPAVCSLRREECVPGARLFACGWRCARHTPAAMEGRCEPPPGPGWPAGAWATPSPQAASSLTDEKAVASGKRRSSAAGYRSAQAEAARRSRPSSEGTQRPGGPGDIPDVETIALYLSPWLRDPHLPLYLETARETIAETIAALGRRGLGAEGSMRAEWTAAVEQHGLDQDLLAWARRSAEAMRHNRLPSDPSHPDAPSGLTYCGFPLTNRELVEVFGADVPDGSD
jgi:hypothetical protein